MKVKEEKDYKYPDKEEIRKSCEDLGENNNDIQMILGRKYFKEMK